MLLQDCFLCFPHSVSAAETHQLLTLAASPLQNSFGHFAATQLVLKFSEAPPET